MLSYFVFVALLISGVVSGAGWNIPFQSILSILSAFALGTHGVRFFLTSKKNTILSDFYIKTYFAAACAAFFIFIIYLLWLMLKSNSHLTYYETMNWASYFAVYMVAAFLSAKYKEGIFDSIVWIGVFSAVFFIVQKFFSPHPPSDMTTWGLLPKKNIFNALISCALLILIVSYIKGGIYKRGLKNFVAFLVLMCAWFFSFTVSSVMGFIFAVVVMIISNVEWQNKKHLRLISVAVALILGGAILSVKLNQPNVWDRVVWYKAAVDMLVDHPLSGVGLGRFAEFLGGYIGGRAGGGVLHSYYAHSFYLEVLAETGIVGFILVAVVFYFSIKNSYKDIRVLVVTAFIMIMGLMDFIFNFPMIPIILFTMLGVGGGCQLKGDDSLRYKCIKIKISYGYIMVFMVILYSILLIYGAIVKYNLWYKDCQKELVKMSVVR